MGVTPKPDFSGWATKAGLKCADGRTILPNAFQHQDKMQVPLIWSHSHNGPQNVLGHAILENRPEGVYCYGFFNETPQGVTAKALVKHKDVNKLSIYANALVEKMKSVVHGMIREVSLVIAGANPGAEIDVVHDGMWIDFVTLQHGDGTIQELEDEAIIHTGLEIELPEIEHAAGSTSSGNGPTLQEIFDSLSPEQKDLVNYMVGTALQSGSAAHSDGASSTDGNNLSHQEGNGDMPTGTTTHNVFEGQNGNGGAGSEDHSLSHDAMKGIFERADKLGSLKEAVEEYALAHGVENLDVLFPNAKNITNTPEFIKRRTEWVSGVISGVGHTPFARVKSLFADITMPEARAKGWIKGNMKKEEFFSVTKRTTGPGWIYKKQKLNRQDIIDITDFDFVMFVKGEMRLMLEEEFARAILIGDGRDADDPDKIQDPVGEKDGLGIRSILNDHDMFVTRVNVPDNITAFDLTDQIVESMQHYRGTGSPVLYTTLPRLTKLLLQRDSLNRRLYRTKAELASELGVSDIIPVEPMEELTDVVGIIVNLADYNVGADKGGEVSLFDFFDIDYNDYKYLMETYISGALTKYKSAVVIREVVSTDAVVVPTEPTFVNSTGVVTIPTVANVTYKNADTGATLAAGAQPALAEGAVLNVTAVPAAGHYFTEEPYWTFEKVGA